jgi:hypothetical protein
MEGAYLIAAKDISAYIKQEFDVIFTHNGRINGKNDVDVWVVTTHYLFTKKQRALNNLLGIHKINK